MLYQCVRLIFLLFSFKENTNHDFDNTTLLIYNLLFHGTKYKNRNKPSNYYAKKSPPTTFTPLDAVRRQLTAVFKKCFNIIFIKTVIM